MSRVIVMKMALITSSHIECKLPLVPILINLRESRSSCFLRRHFFLERNLIFHFLFYLFMSRLINIFLKSNSDFFFPIVFLRFLYLWMSWLNFRYFNFFFFRKFIAICKFPNAESLKITIF